MDFTAFDGVRNETNSFADTSFITNNREGVDATVMWAWLSTAIVGLAWPIILMVLPMN